MDRRKIIMDVDTGSDDAIALVLAMLDPELDCLGICSVNGNIEVKLTTDNSLRVVECCDKQGQVKVYKGSDLPIASTLMPWTAQSLEPHPVREGAHDGKISVHQDHLPLPVPTIHEEEQCAASWLIETLMKSDGDITLVPVGPLTNVALAMRSEPRICSKIKEIILMGGGDRVSNHSLAAEFNAWADPEAFEIVLQSGCKITMVPLDATHKALINEEQAAKLREIGTKPALLCAELIDQRIEAYGEEDKDMGSLKAAPIHDALAVCAVLHPECLKNVVHCDCHCDISRGYSYGRTNLDLRYHEPDDPRNVYFAYDADTKVFFDYMYRILSEDKVRRGL